METIFRIDQSYLFFTTLMQKDLQGQWVKIRKVLHENGNQHLVDRLEEEISTANDDLPLPDLVKEHALRVINSVAKEAFDSHHFKILGEKLMKNIKEMLKSFAENDENSVVFSNLENEIKLAITEGEKVITSNAEGASNVLRTYDMEMEKQIKDCFYKAPSLLEGYNKNAIESAKAKANFELTEKIKGELNLMFLNSFSKFKNRNRKRYSEVSAIGVDFSETNFSIAIYESIPRMVYIIPNEHGQKKTPCYIYISEDDEVIVGYEARLHAHIYRKNTIYDILRVLGKKFDDIKPDNELWPFSLEDNEGYPVYKINGRSYKPEFFVTLLFQQINRIVEANLKTKIPKVVIAVPDYLNDAGINAVHSCARDAGFQCLDIICKSAAAVISHNLHERSLKRKILVLNVGRKTTEATILKSYMGKIQIKGKSCNTQIGGQSFDYNIVDFCVEEFKQREGINLRRNYSSDDAYVSALHKCTLFRIKNKCEKQKIQLFSPGQNVVTIELDSIYGNKDFRLPLSREGFVGLNQGVFHEIMKNVEHALLEAGLNKSEINDIVLVGKSMAIPYIQHIVTNLFCQNIALGVYAAVIEEGIAKGAAIRAAILNGCTLDELQVMDTFGILCKDEVIDSDIEENIILS